MAYQRKTDEEITNLARQLYRNEIFCSFQLPKDQLASLLPMVFMPIFFLDKETIKQWQADGIQHFYADMKYAGPRSINGYPIFTVMQGLNKEDGERLCTQYLKIEQAIDNI